MLRVKGELFSKLSSATFKVNSIICDRKMESLSNFSEATIEIDIFFRTPGPIFEQVFGDSPRPNVSYNRNLHGVWI